MRIFFVVVLALTLVFAGACKKQFKINHSVPLTASQTVRLNVKYSVEGGKPVYNIKELNPDEIVLSKAAGDKIQWIVNFKSRMGDAIDVAIEDFQRIGGGSSPPFLTGNDCALTPTNPNKFCLSLRNTDTEESTKNTSPSGNLGENGRYKYTVAITFPGGTVMKLDPMIRITD